TGNLTQSRSWVGVRATRHFSRPISDKPESCQHAAMPLGMIRCAAIAFAESTTMRLMILNGPNLNLLGVREPHIYGTTTLASIKASCEEFARFAGAQLSFHQSNNEGVLVDIIQSAREQADAIIIN